MTMVRFSCAALLVMLLSASAGVVAVSAHELLPAAIVEFMESNPDATPEQVEAFMDQNPDTYGNDTQSRAGIIAAVRSPQQTNALDIFLDFLKLGIEHILEGLDHVLFVLSLLLVFRSLKETLKLVSIFTVAHSITLLLAGSEVFRLSSSVVEPLIAFSIAYVALTSVFLGERHPFFADHKGKGISVFLFGLFHGMGFAGLLEELAIPDAHFFNALVSFNVGIEIGQLMIIGIALPLILMLRRTSFFRPVTRVTAVLISVVAIFWVVQRTIGA